MSRSDIKKPNVIPSRRSFLTGAAALTGGAAVLASINDGARAAGAAIPVGQAAPLTDFAAADGVEFKNGLTLACEEINALGGILGRPLEPYFEDTVQMGDATTVQRPLAVASVRMVWLGPHPENCSTVSSPLQKLI